MKKFIMMVGPSYSGKSHIAKYLCGNNNNCKVFSSDDLREELFGDVNDQTHNSEVFDELHKRIHNFFKENDDCIAIYDATNLSSKRRKAFLNTIPVGVFKECIIACCSYLELVKRFNSRERVVPWRVVEKQLQSFQTPMWFEGWDSIIPYPTSTYYSAQKLLKECETLSHDNPHHTLTVGQHMNLCEEIAQKQSCKHEEVVRFAAKYHDIGKLYTKTFINKNTKQEGSIAHFYGHEGCGAYLILSSQEARNAFTADLRDIRSLVVVSALISYHMQRFTRDEKSLEKLFKQFGEYGNDLMVLMNCDVLAH